MIRKNAYRRIILASLSLIVVAITCFYPKNNWNNNINTKYLDAIKMPIYILDENNYVSRINIIKSSENIEENISYIINTLTEGSKESSYLINSFNPIIPEGTILLNYELKDKILKLNFNENFTNVSENKERKLIESLIYSLCEFNEIENIMIFINDKRLEFLPNSKEKLPILLNKNYGINVVYDLDNVKNCISTTSYYLAKSKDATYHVPITKIENSNKEKIEVIIENLQTSPANQTSLISYLKASASMDYYKILEESVFLSFNNELFADLNNEEVLEEVRYSIYLSIRDTYDVSQVIFESSTDINVAIFN